MSFDFDAETTKIVQHYVALCRQYPAQVPAWREQARKLAREHEEWIGLEDRVRAALKVPA